MARCQSPHTRSVLSHRQKIGLVFVALYVAGAAALSVAHFAAGEWIQGTVWAASAAGFALGYEITVARIWRA
jgi:hypothetical protein